MTTQKYLEKFTKDIFKKLGYTVKITVNKIEGGMEVDLEGDNLGMIIGHHGTTLNSLAHVLTLAATQQAGEFTRVTLDAGGWRKDREEQLEQMAMHAIERVRNSGKPYEFPPMSPAERRIVHMIISENEDVISESEGEGDYRHLVVKPS